MTREELLNTAKPILFNPDMVRAIMDGKTVTRRKVKLPKYIQKQENGLYTLFTEGTCYKNQHMEQIIDYLKKPYQPGDILYVRETWKIVNHLEKLSLKFEYEADGKISDFIDFTSNRLQIFLKYINKKGWCPALFMPKEAARIFLKVTDVRMKRLQDMVLDDFLDEGVELRPETFNDPENAYGEAKNIYKGIWNSTLKKSDINRYGWESNPWVWVIEFKKMKII